MKHQTSFVLGACFFLAACNSTEKQAQEDFRAHMKDPDSAKFGRFKARGNKACLEVNGKNSFGGYTGMETAFLNRDEQGKWSGYADTSGLLDWDYCVKDLDKAGS